MRRLSVIPLALLLTLGCDRVKDLMGEKPAPSATAATAAASATSASSGAPTAAEAQDPCKVVEEKVWTKGANTRTGLTVRQLGSKLAIGIAIGQRPHVLTLEPGGAGQLHRLAVKATSPLAKAIAQAEGSRDLQRVTPIEHGGVLDAYADYRDKWKSGRRRIACEELSSGNTVLAFDGIPLLKRPQPGGRLKSLAAVRGRLNSLNAAPAATAAGGDSEGGEELRDCRTFVALDGHVFGVGSELTGKQEGDAVKWTMRIFSAPQAGRKSYTLYKRSLSKTPRDPQDLHTLEAPVFVELGGGDSVILGRYRGALLGFSLDKNYKPSARHVRYTGGYPALPHFFVTADQRLLLAGFKGSDGNWSLARGSISESGSLPQTLAPWSLSSLGSSLSEASLAQLADQRWVLVHDGKRREGKMVLAPVDAELKVQGPGHTFSGEDAYESGLFSLGNELLVVRIRRDSAELVTTRLSCQKAG